MSIFLFCGTLKRNSVLPSFGMNDVKIDIILTHCHVGCWLVPSGQLGFLIFKFSWVCWMLLACNFCHGNDSEDYFGKEIDIWSRLGHLIEKSGRYAYKWIKYFSTNTDKWGMVVDW